jgi:hypothetical protein
MDKLNKIKQLAIENQAILISDTVKSPNEYYLFEDLEGNRFEIRAESLIKKGWPKNLKDYLSRSKKMQKTGNQLFNEMKELAKENDGKLIDTEWKGCWHKYLFESKQGEVFYKTHDSIRKNGWPKNYKKDTRNNDEKYQELKEIIKSRNGILLTPNWLGFKVKHEIINYSGEIFYLTPERIKQGAWLPDRGLVSEPICRQTLNHLFGYQFIKTQKILTPEITGRTRSLELDGYCKELNIAFEYQGHDSHWDKNHKDYIKVSEKDKLKNFFCKKLNIVLIVIPMFKEEINKWHEEKVLSHIMKEIKSTFKK